MKLFELLAVIDDRMSFDQLCERLGNMRLLEGDKRWRNLFDKLAKLKLAGWVELHRINGKLHQITLTETGKKRKALL
jgi:hypothetical protein